jgi:hypothetical protein
MVKVGVKMVGRRPTQNLVDLSMQFAVPSCLILE